MRLVVHPDSSRCHSRHLPRDRNRQRRQRESWHTEFKSQRKGARITTAFRLEIPSESLAKPICHCPLSPSTLLEPRASGVHAPLHGTLQRCRWKSDYHINHAQAVERTDLRLL